jgi:PAS domain S-box-containing protein
MNDCDDDENETTVVVESMHMCCIPTRIMPHTKYKRETVHKINPNYFIHCNYIHNHLHSYFKKYYSTILEDTKLERIIDKFPILRQLNNESMEDIFVSFYRTCGVYLQNISEKEYRWLNRVIYISEYLPISVTINRVDKSFPFVYVNREFEHMTEYTWEETVGKPYTFLQPKNPIANEKLQNKIMTNCVTNGIPVSVIVTNEKKGGRPFYNLLALNPVCDKEGHYLYVVGIQTPIRNGEETTRMNIHSIQNVIDLMYIFSNCNIETDIRVGTTLRC